ncbi:MAG: hypothetical protein R3Y11_05885 [Pseudomonadota bacterium]
MHKGFFTDVMQHRPALFATMLTFNGLAPHGASREGLSASPESLAGSSDGEQSASQAACLRALANVQGLSASGMATLAASPVVQRHMQASGLMNMVPQMVHNEDQDLSETLLSFDSASPLLFSDVPQTASTPQSFQQFWDFAEESRRLAFLSHQELSSLLQHFGVAIHAKHYAHLVHSTDVVALRRALGAEVYAYGLVRGRFQVGSVASFFTLRSQALGSKGQHFDVQTLLHNIHRDGDVALGVCMATWPQHLQERTCALMGRPIAPIYDADASVVRGVWFALKKLLLREVAPQWAPCFD